MKRRSIPVLAAILSLALCACGAAGEAEPAQTPAVSVSAPTPTAAPAETPVPTEPPVPAETAASRPVTPEPADGWAGTYLAFLEDNYDIFAALWPDGISGVGYIDLDLDGTPEMILFDQGASATLGAQMFDLVDGQVYCVSSVLDAAKGAFDDAHFASASVCTSYFESFRLARTADGFTFWVSSENGTMEDSWSEILRFELSQGGGALAPVSVCTQLLTVDPETGKVTEERYLVGGEPADKAAYEAAAAVYTEAPDLGYEGKGVFLWNDMQRYDTTCDGLLAMAQDAAEAYVPVA